MDDVRGRGDIGGGGGVRGGGDTGSGGGGEGVRGGGDTGSGGCIGLSADPVDDPLNVGLLLPGIYCGVGLSMNIPCILISCHNWSISVLSGIEGVWPALFVDHSGTGFTRFCNAAGTVPSASMGPSSFSRTAATGAPNTKLTTWQTMKKIRRVRVILCRRICVGYIVDCDVASD